MSSMIKCCFEPIELPEFLDSAAQRCTAPGCCCGCCSALRPRYKRLVDNIFPVNPEDGLVKSNMEKLTFYSLSSPEKLDRIGDYLYQKATKDIHRKRYKLVEIAMEAMDLLLMACHVQTLNLFVESFLKMVQKLLEDSNANLQIMATNSFVRFANIEEDTPSYHRRYDFFISKFSSMCHGNHDDIELRDSIRMAGIKGLQGVIRKTVSDDLVENIWEKQHMDKIVPSLLFNMQSGPLRSIEEATPSSPPELAESVLRELVSRASFAHIRSVLKPLLTHLDRHELWVPNQFAIHTFRIVMLSIQPQYSYTVVEILMQHLDTNLQSSPKTRTSLAVVLSKIIAIAAGESVGPSALDIINNLLTHLRTSVGTSEDPPPEEAYYQEALINALGEFANHHPDYQKIEIMLFIMNTVPDLSKKSHADQMLQNILLKSLLKVGMQYRTVSYEKAFPVSFLQPLLRMARSPHAPTRIIVMQILQALLDRHQNQAVLHVVSARTYTALSLESPSRADILFMHKYGGNVMRALVDALSLDERLDSLAAAYNAAALLVVETACGETLQDFLLFIMGIQVSGTDTEGLSASHRANLHSIAIALLALLARCTGVNTLMEYCEKIIEARKEEARHMLPPLDDPSFSLDQLAVSPPHLLMDKLALAEALQQAGLEHTRVQTGDPFAIHQEDTFAHRPSWVDAPRTGSNPDLGAYNDGDSVTSSPDVQRRPLPTELNFESMKRLLTESSDGAKKEARERKATMAKYFREANFDELVRRSETRHDAIQNKLNELFTSLANERQIAQNENKGTLVAQKKIYEQAFPELFFF